MDHFGWDSKRGRLLVAAVGNDTVEVIEEWRRTQTIGRLDHPQAVAYLPTIDAIAISTKSGAVRFYSAASYKPIGALDFGAGADADDMRYDPKSRLLFVSVGDGLQGRLVAIDPAKLEAVRDIRLGSHPESFQIGSTGRIFANLPDQHAIAAIDWATGKVTKWILPEDANHHTLALDEAHHRLFTAGLQPGSFLVVDADEGRLIENLPCVLGVDDLWFDSSRRRIYASGAGSIDIFRQVDADRYAEMDRVEVGPGAGSTSIRIKTRTQDSLYVSWPNMLPQGGSAVALYYVGD